MMNLNTPYCHRMLVVLIVGPLALVSPSSSQQTLASPNDVTEVFTHLDHQVTTSASSHQDTDSDDVNASLTSAETRSSSEQPLWSPIDNGQSYRIDSFVLEYVRPIPTLPDLSPLLEQTLPVQRQGERIVLLEGAVDTDSDDASSGGLKFGELTALGPIVIDSATLGVIIETLQGELWKNQSLRRTISVDPRDIALDTGNDNRMDDSLRLLISYEGRSYAISQVDLAFAGEMPSVPMEPTDILNNVVVQLSPVENGYVAWRPDTTIEPLRLGDLPTDPPLEFSAGAIQTMLEAVRDELNAQGFMAVRVVPGSGQFDRAMRDVREDDSTVLQLQMAVGHVAEIRTMATGDRIPREDRIDHPAHTWIREKSPIQPESEYSHGLLEKQVLDEYLFRISRHPGRRVDAAIAPAEDPLGIALDYIVTENKPWLVYGQVSNTGTASTGRIRYRTGFIHNQLTGNDDILRLDAITADFDDTWAVAGSYDARIGDSDRWRYRIFADHSQFGSSEVGFAVQSFRGKSFGFGGEVTWNFFQDRELFLDAIFGARVLHTRIENQVIDVTGEETFLFPYAGVRLERNTLTERTNAAAYLEFNPGIGIDDDELGRLGRFEPDDDWVLFKWDASHAFFLEPILNRRAWEDTSTPKSSTLAHEIALRFRGQYAFDQRLIPQVEQVAGGLYSVRGYPESIAVGDTAILASAEYRFHVPQAFGINVEPGTLFGKPFRVQPQYPYGRADWDLVLRGFVDAGWTHNSDSFPGEDDQTLVGAGVGIELTVKRNLEARLDWGFALSDVDDEYDAGNERLHFMLTILY